jgi:hypothetical protein
MNLPIRNKSDLREAIFHLEGLEQQQSLAIKERFSSPAATISTVFSLFSNSSGTGSGKDAGFFSQDFLGLISRFLLPITLNKTIFRHSNFLIKTLVGVLSQKASHYISEDSVGNAFNKAKGWFDGLDGNSGILGTIRSLFEAKKGKKAVNHPTHTPTQQNVLKPQL